MEINVIKVRGFESRIEVLDSGCWMWLGARDGSGYGRVTINKREWRIHRYVYMKVHGDIQDDMVITHTCNVRVCCNPDHLNQTSREESTQRAMCGRRIETKRRIFDIHSFLFFYNLFLNKGLSKRRLKGVSKLILVDNECWIWQGYIDIKGYGRYHHKSKNVQAHRYVYQLVKKENIGKGLVLDHLCRTRCCVNPDHLRPVSTNTNALENSLSL